METKRMIPFSVYLPSDMHQAMTEIAKGRKASSMVREAISMLINDMDVYDSAYKTALGDCIHQVNQDSLLTSISCDGETLAKRVKNIIDLLQMDAVNNKLVTEILEKNGKSNRKKP
jgi:predicted DNA-binding protein